MCTPFESAARNSVKTSSVVTMNISPNTDLAALADSAQESRDSLWQSSNENLQNVLEGVHGQDLLFAREFSQFPQPLFEIGSVRSGLANPKRGRGTVPF